MSRFHVTLAVFATQCLLSLVAGNWAAQAAESGSETIGIYAGVATAFGFAAAVGAAYAFNSSAGSIMMMLGLANHINRANTSPPPPPGSHDRREQRQEFVLHLLTFGVHMGALLLLFLLVAGAVALHESSHFLPLAWRFLLAGLLLGTLSWRGLKILSY